MTQPIDTTAPTASYPRRCFGNGIPLYEAYHDHEWGVPVHGEVPLFERLVLEAFQTGLSWVIILRKRENFREAFAGFVPDAVARFTEDDVARLLADTGIVRNRAKIEAAIASAKAAVAFREAGGDLDELVWHHRPARHKRPRSPWDVQAKSAESIELSKALKRIGFQFVGPTTAYAAMQACGLVNDHFRGCTVGDALAKAQKEARAA
ncbi:MAG: DNA-3-methyladenine glycosylase I [Bifidobacteriaceae bacterium]|jgi:DNA-3-methyladenine glycosylase I|nr:DNA-3-methyladenine glycosylase I [Bifidobacteriaceae bacterium]